MQRHLQLYCAAYMFYLGFVRVMLSLAMPVDTDINKHVRMAARIRTWIMPRYGVLHDDL